MDLKLNAHHEALDRVIAKHTVAGNSSLAEGVYLQIRAVRGQKNKDGSWSHEYRLEEVNPFETD